MHAAGGSPAGASSAPVVDTASSRAALDDGSPRNGSQDTPAGPSGSLRGRLDTPGARSWLARRVRGARGSPTSSADVTPSAGLPLRRAPAIKVSGDGYGPARLGPDAGLRRFTGWRAAVVLRADGLLWLGHEQCKEPAPPSASRAAARGRRAARLAAGGRICVPDAAVAPRWA